MDADMVSQIGMGCVLVVALADHNHSRRSRNNPKHIWRRTRAIAYSEIEYVSPMANPEGIV